MYCFYFKNIAKPGDDNNPRTSPFVAIYLSPWTPCKMNMLLRLGKCSLYRRTNGPAFSKGLKLMSPEII
jgi:hypothetical protein